VLFLLVIASETSPLWAEKQLVIISPHWEGIRYEFGEAFRTAQKRQTGEDIDIRWLDEGGASDVLKSIRSQYKKRPNGIGVDLLFGGGTDPFEELKRLGFLETYPIPQGILQKLGTAIGGIPLYDADRTWYSAALSGFGIVYNKIVLKRLGLPEPQTWEDLARPELFTWVGSADPRKSGSVHMMYEIILQAYGWDRGWQIITALGGNVRGFTSSSAQTPQDVALGEVAYGLAIDSYAWSQIKRVGNNMIGYVMPEHLTVVNGDAIAILKGAPNKQLAQQFINFVLSEPGQKLWMLNVGEPDGPQQFELGRFCVLPSLYPILRGRTSINLNPFLWQSRFTYDATMGSSRSAVINDLIGSMIIDSHERLARAWGLAIRHRRHNTELKRLATMPLTEQDVKAIADHNRWHDQTFRNQTIRKWASLARNKYGHGQTNTQWLGNLPTLIGLICFVILLYYARRGRW